MIHCWLNQIGTLLVTLYHIPLHDYPHNPWRPEHRQPILLPPPI